MGCAGLQSVTIEEGVQTIGEGAFSECRGLTSITIPNSVTKIETYAFYCCTGLAEITSRATTAPQLGNSVFEYVDDNGKLYIPSGATGYNAWTDVLPSSWELININ